MLSTISSILFNKQDYKSITFGAKVNTLDAMETLLRKPQVPNEAQVSACKQMTGLTHITPNQITEIFIKCRKALIQDTRMRQVIKDYLAVFKGKKERPHDVDVMAFKLHEKVKIFENENQIEVPDVKVL